MKTPLKIVLATEIGTAAYLRVYESNGQGKCSGATGRRGSKLSYHSARARIATSTQNGAWGFAGDVSDYEGDSRWPVACDGCGKTWDELAGDAEFTGIREQVFHDRLYDTEDGGLSPGCMFWADWDHWEEEVTGRYQDGKLVDFKVPTACPAGWSNCDGRHLHVICPDGHEWDVDSRASNCTLQSDQEHRCWVRTGEPPEVTAGKGGKTCSAGAGSIQTPSWHGFLRAGQFV